MSKDFLWVEKYRPKTISDCILPEQLQTIFSNVVSSGEMPNMLLTGTAGLGKTTVAKAICNELNLDYILINGSEEGNIDTLRGKIKQFASSVSLSGGYKVVILDEADYLNPQSTQPALRGFIEEFSDNCRFILTCNFKNKIIEPLHSRCGVYEFNTNRKTLADLAGKFLNRLEFILNEEKVKYKKPLLVEIIMKHAPDWRRIINECQRHSMTGFLNSEAIISTSNYDDLFVILKEKNFKKMRQWVVNNIDQEASSIFRGLYDRMNDKLDSGSIPQVVLILADYQHKHAFVADPEINVVACLTELMANATFK